MSWKERPNCKWYTSWSEKRLDRIAELGKILQNLAQSFTFLHILAQSCGGNWQYKWNTPKLMAFHFRQNSFKALYSRVAKKQCTDTFNLGIFLVMCIHFLYHKYPTIYMILCLNHMKRVPSRQMYILWNPVKTKRKNPLQNMPSRKKPC